MHPLLFLGLLGAAGALLFYAPRRQTYIGTPTAFDPRMDPATVQAVDYAIGTEMNPSVLRTFADKLDAAGYYSAAEHLRAKAARVEQGLEF
jgi:hypothetical protein